MAKKLVVGITQGDGNGISYEVIIKALADERILDMCTPVIYGSSKIFGFYKKQIHNIDQINTNVISSAKDVHQKRVNIVNCLPENVFVEPGQSTPESAKAAMIALEKYKNGEAVSDKELVSTYLRPCQAEREREERLRSQESNI